MNEAELLSANIDRIHTTEKGAERIRRNLGITDSDIEKYCRNIVLNNRCKIRRCGKNWYCETDDAVITVNASSYTVITAHKTTPD